jgi:acyl-coenzyme A thioesterase PaaI-like protein
MLYALATAAPVSDPSVIHVPEIGWTSVDSRCESRPIRSFVSADPTSDFVRIAYFRREHDGALVGKVWFGPGVEGLPGHAHGGGVAAVLDDAMGVAAWMAGHHVLASTLQVRFRMKVPLHHVVFVEAAVRASHGPRLHVNGKVCDNRGAPFAESAGLLTQITSERDQAPPKISLTGQ